MSDQLSDPSRTVVKEQFEPLVDVARDPTKPNLKAVKRGWKIFQLPSGKHTKNYGKIHYKWSFSIAMLVYQRVNGVVYVCLMGKYGKIFELNGGFLSFPILPMLDVGYVHHFLCLPLVLCSRSPKMIRSKMLLPTGRHPQMEPKKAGPSRPTLDPQMMVSGTTVLFPKEEGEFQVCEVSVRYPRNKQQISNNYCNESLTNH